MISITTDEAEICAVALAIVEAGFVIRRGEDEEEVSRLENMVDNLEAQFEDLVNIVRPIGKLISLLREE